MLHLYFSSWQIPTPFEVQFTDREIFTEYLLCSRGWRCSRQPDRALVLLSLHALHAGGEEGTHKWMTPFQIMKHYVERKGSETQ